jgi:SAM-dependent methyltransferase
MIDQPGKRTEMWQGFFSHPQYSLFAGAIVGPERTRTEVSQIIDILDLAPGARIFDLGCGNGRIAIPLAQAGYSVTGLDASESLLAIAQQSAATGGVDLSLLRAEMKAFTAPAQFDAAINVGTAFGYVDSLEDDLAALRNVFELLTPGGVFLLETENRDHRVRTGRRIWFELAGMLVWCDRGYDATTGRWQERIEWIVDGQREHVEYSLRLYTVAELVTMLNDVGFAVLEAWGELSKVKYELDSPRAVILARKPASVTLTT